MCVYVCVCVCLCVCVTVSMWKKQFLFKIRHSPFNFEMSGRLTNLSVDVGICRWHNLDKVLVHHLH